ncbi:hypothetical protein CKA32_007048 [Geitlerinema sp. FC II]|nr:hypothetical protein CKA32_007048 [Geitlerinema sp. FC II]
MPKGNPKPIQTPEFKAQQYKPVGEIDEPLAKKVTGVKLPKSVSEAIDALPREEKVRWLRQTLVNAAKAELMK